MQPPDVFAWALDTGIALIPDEDVDNALDQALDLLFEEEGWPDGMQPSEKVQPISQGKQPEAIGQETSQGQAKGMESSKKGVPQLDDNLELEMDKGVVVLRSLDQLDMVETGELI